MNYFGEEADPLRPELSDPCGNCGHPLESHQAGPEGACKECTCIGWEPVKKE